MNTTSINSKALYDKIRSDFIGLNTKYQTANGEKSRRIYLDSTASTLMMTVAYNVMEKFFHHYANTHSLLHFSAKISTKEYAWAHNRILSFVGADPDEYTCFFTGTGTTAGINRMARVFRDIHPEKDTAIISIMEHHSNDLPHRKHMANIIHIPVETKDGNLGCVDIEDLETALKNNKNKINYVAVTGVSNVTGIVNPINNVAKLAHKYGALFLVDGAQLVAHIPIQMSHPENPEKNIDALVFSGHKTYAPGSPGVVIARKDLLLQIEPEEVGGGMVQDVYVDRYVVKDFFPDREEAGTPNIPGAIALAASIDILDRIGMDFLMCKEDKLIRETIRRIKQIPTIQIYGEPNPDVCDRVASISFNIKNIDHGLTAAILNDYFNIAVRNECFCAHPYVKEMIMDDLLEASEQYDIDELESVYHLKRGMVRASFGLYSTIEDIQILIGALKDISDRKDFYKSQYEIDKNWNYKHKFFNPDYAEVFSVESSISELIR